MSTTDDQVTNTGIVLTATEVALLESESTKKILVAERDAWLAVAIVFSCIFLALLIFGIVILARSYIQKKVKLSKTTEQNTV